MAYVKKHCPGGCSGCNNCYAQVDCSNRCSGCRGRSGCKHHSCGGCSSSGCSSCNSGCSGCHSCRNGFGTLRSISRPFSNCGNWWNNEDYFPYYTGPCGPCDPCEQCCCKEWPWPWPPFIPVNNEYGHHHSGVHHAGEDEDCEYHHNHTGYTSNKNCYQTEASSHEACASRRVKPIVDCTSCRHDCNN